ncbi:MAG: DUF1566 domain-containing protein [Epsilonproteobacteria bacterium]|nr:DUF1566 domain-containing protein [Campylobacterota bacterium]
MLNKSIFGSFFLLLTFVGCGSSSSKSTQQTFNHQPLPILKTGQNQSYDFYGEVVANNVLKDNGYYQSGLEINRIRVNDIVYDYQTNRAWYDGVESIYSDYKSAEQYCSTLRVGEYTNWRLPTLYEIHSIKYLGYYEEIFINRKKGVNYWTLSDYNAALEPNTRDKSKYTDGVGAIALNVTQDAHVFCVQNIDMNESSILQSNVQYMRSHKDIVIDNYHNLMWDDLKDHSSFIDQGLFTSFNPQSEWENKIATCEALILGGYDDWRLPNINELTSLIDVNYIYPAVNPIFEKFRTRTTKAATGHLYSATSNNFAKGRALTFRPQTGDILSEYKGYASMSMDLICVRDYE